MAAEAGTREEGRKGKIQLRPREIIRNCRKLAGARYFVGHLHACKRRPNNMSKIISRVSGLLRRAYTRKIRYPAAAALSSPVLIDQLEK